MFDKVVAALAITDDQTHVVSDKGQHVIDDPKHFLRFEKWTEYKLINLNHGL